MNIEDPLPCIDNNEDTETFDERAASFAKAARRIRLTRNSAKQLESIVTAALGEISLDE